MTSDNWYNMFPHSEYSIRNLDWLISKYGEQDDAIKKLQESDALQDTILSDHETRIVTLTNAVADIEPRLATAEDDIDTLEGRADDLERRATTLEATVVANTSDIATNTSDIATIKSDIATIDTSIGSIDTNIDNIESDISDISNTVGSMQNDINALDSRVTNLEGSEVIANPGGIGVTLNTIKVGSQVYSIPSGGGSSGGSIVTPNASGTPTGVLTSLGVDAAIFTIPDSRADIITLDNRVTSTESDIDILEDRVDAIESDISLSKREFGDLTVQTGPNVIEENDLPYQRFELSKGVYIIHLRGVFNTSSMGSKRRDLGLYISDESNNRLASDKFVVWGSETAQITSAATLECSYYVEVAENQTLTLHPSIRCQVASGSYEYECEFVFDCVKLK